MNLHNDSNTLTRWLAPSSQTSLNVKEVIVWRVLVDQAQAATYWPLLSQDEQARAQRFHFAKDRKVFVVARGVLRLLISRYLPANPASITFSKTEFGKPFLPDSSLHFNLSHSGNIVLLAFARDIELGVDVEQYKPLPDLADIAQNFFSAQEQTALFSLPISEQQAAFFRLWSRKEAFIKERGEGLSHPLDSFDVSLSAENPQLLATRKSAIDVVDYTIQALNVEDGYESAVAITRADWHFKFYNWEEETMQ